MMGANVFFSLISVFLLTTACAAPKSTPHPVYDTGEVKLWSACSPEEGDRNAASADTTARIRALSCYAYLSEAGKSASAQLEWVKKGRKLAGSIIAISPENGTAHYLAAYLAGRNAELETLKGLDLVKVIEHEALRAAELSPKLDYGGPDRMLGELYLKAPCPPVSVGDLDKSFEHYEKAVNIAPEYAYNRLGLASAYLEDDYREKACVQYNKIMKLRLEKNILANEDFRKLRSACSGDKSSRK